ncbi:MAG TPA: hypothetical protein VHD35_07765 [Chitinophagaceae bacterium]|nr:hypothetical protein [Chitinophagaceae bacterium]
MCNLSVTSYYLFKGDWYDIFSRLLDDVSTNDDRKFDIWEPVDKHKEYKVIVVYGAPLSLNFCVTNKIWKTHEKIFDAFYSGKEYQYNIHSNYYLGFNEEEFSDTLLTTEYLIKSK